MFRRAGRSDESRSVMDQLGPGDYGPIHAGAEDLAASYVQELYGVVQKAVETCDNIV